VVRTVRIGLAVAAGAVALAGCGESGKLDEGQFSAGDRKAARAVLSTLAQSNLWHIAERTTLMESSSPAACVLHIETAKPLTFKLFMTWIPSAAAQRGVFRGNPRAYVWLEAVLGREGLQKPSSLHLGNEHSLKELKSHYGDAFTKPVERCVVLADGTFGLLAPAD
jgi:hypothetical protein